VLLVDRTTRTEDLKTLLIRVGQAARFLAQSRPAEPCCICLMWKTAVRRCDPCCAVVRSGDLERNSQMRPVKCSPLVAPLRAREMLMTPDCGSTNSNSNSLVPLHSERFHELIQLSWISAWLRPIASSNPA